MFAQLFRSALVLTGLWSALAGPAAAQAHAPWPSRPIRLVVAGAPGQGSDILARVVGNSLSKALGQPVIVENKPGATGIIAAADVVKAPADGYTLLFTNASFTVVLQAVGQKMPYDLMRDLTPVAQIGQGGVFLVASSDFPAADLQQFVAVVKAHPDKYQYATFGNGSTGHLTMEWLKSQTGMVIGTVPYKSTVQILQDLQTGLLQVAMVDVNSSLPMIRAGKIKALALGGTTRAPATPEVRTMADQGYPFNTNGWYGMFAPANTPKEIVQRVNAAVNEALTAPESQQLLLNLNIGSAPAKTPAAFAATMREDIQNWTAIAKTRGIQLDN